MSYIPPAESTTSLTTYRLYKQEQTLQQISESRKLAITTIMSHLEIYIANGEITDISGFVTEEKIPKIKAAFEKHGDAVLSPVMETLGKENFTYDELKVVRAWVHTHRK